MVTHSILPLRLENVEARRRGKHLVGPVSMTVGADGFTVLMGPNGAGKTSLLRLMHGLDRVNRGRLQWSVPEVEARKHQAYVFQTPTMMRRSARENIAFPLIAHGVPRRQAFAQADDWLDRVGLRDCAHKPAPCLSGGEQQKLALARALIRKPQILFLDEPCANLDGRATLEIEKILRDTHAGGTRIVMVTHDHAQAQRLADDILFIHHGRLCETATASGFFDNPQTAEAAAFVNGDILL